MSFSLRLLFLGCVLLLSGCSTVYRPTGWVIYDFTEDYAIPHTMESDDVAMACGMTESMLPVLLSFTRVAYTPDQLATVMNMLLGACAQAQAQEESLAYARAIYEQQVSAAQDARIREKRAYALTAQRQYTSYRHMVKAFGEPGEQCPSLTKDEEYYWVMGNLAGMQAVLSDLKAQSVIGVPKDIAMKAVRGMQCVDSQAWWGLPEALQAGIWLMMPDGAPAGVDPWVKMANAEQQATQSGVRLAHAIAVIIADDTGHTEQARQAIRVHAASLKEHSSDPRYRLIDSLANQQILAVSDRLWTEGTGSRTPVGELGRFWDQKKEPALDLNIDDLLGE